MVEDFDRGGISIVKSKKTLDIRVPSVDTEEKNEEGECLLNSFDSTPAVERIL